MQVLSQPPVKRMAELQNCGHGWRYRLLRSTSSYDHPECRLRITTALATNTFSYLLLFPPYPPRSRVTISHPPSLVLALQCRFQPSPTPIISNLLKPPMGDCSITTKIYPHSDLTSKSTSHFSFPSELDPVFRGGHLAPLQPIRRTKKSQVVRACCRGNSDVIEGPVLSSASISTPPWDRPAKSRGSRVITPQPRRAHNSSASAPQECFFLSYHPPNMPPTTPTTSCPQDCAI